MIKMQLAERIEIKPTNAQEQVLAEISEKCRLLYNHALAERLKAMEEGKQISYLDQQNSLPRIKEMHSNSQKGLSSAGIPPTSSAERARTR
ncbi:MAG: helix-turn-helix domain-containing protein [Candidatus Micrarchaeia archaeon]